MTDINHWAAYLAAAVTDRNEVAAITKQIDALSIEDAYKIQEALLALQLDGDSLAGAKLGLTSAAKQEQMGVDEPVYGWVRSSSVLGADGVVKLDELIHPRCEPEFMFRLGKDLAGPGVTADDVLDATEEVMGGIEVIDSRYEAFSFTLTDVVADNTSAARIMVGTDGVAPRDVDLREVTCTFEIDGEVTGEATGEALLGDPAACVAMLANHLGAQGKKLEAGWIVPAGAPVDAKPLSPGTVATARYSHFGTVTITGQ